VGVRLIVMLTLQTAVLDELLDVTGLYLCR
jgi:hypothetical protein